MVNITDDLMKELQRLKVLMGLKTLDEALTYAIKFSLLASGEVLPPNVDKSGGHQGSGT